MSDFVKALEAEIEGLERQLEESPVYVKLREAKRLREMYASIQSAKAVPRTRTRQRPLASGASGEILAAVRKYLVGKSEPTPTREILQMLAGEGIEVTGAVPQNVVSSTLSKAEDIKANGRKGWTLKENEPPSEGGSETGEVSASPELYGRDDYRDPLI